MDINNPFEITKNINLKSGRIVFEEDDKPAFFVINKVFSNTPDSVSYANEVNKMTIDDKQMVYDFYYYGLSRRNRFGKYNKKGADNDEKFLNAIMELYDYSLLKAVDSYEILKPYEKEIMKMVFRGGSEKK